MAWKKKNKRIAIGCGVSGCLGLVVAVVLLVVAGSAFLEFGIGTDLSGYEDAIRASGLDSAKKDQLVGAITEVRSSVDRENNFGFFQWLQIDQSIQDLLGDGQIDEGEVDSLLVEIARMKEIQGITDP